MLPCLNQPLLLTCLSQSDLNEFDVNDSDCSIGTFPRFLSLGHEYFLVLEEHRAKLPVIIVLYVHH